MHSTVTFVAQAGLYVVAALAVVVWLTVPRHEKAALVVEMVVGVIVTAVLVKVAGSVHQDPRPFVVDPSVHPWFSHPADNGFPSDHTAVGAVTSFVILRHRRTAGLGLLAITVLIGAARVLAHVHHVQDIVAGLLIGLLAAVLGVVAWHLSAGSSVARRIAGPPATRETASRAVDHRP